MKMTRATFLLSLTILAAGCAVQPKIQLKAGGMTMDVNSKVPLIVAVDFASDGKTIATGGMGGAAGAARLWDLAGAKESIRFKTPPETPIVSGVSYSPDGKTLAVATQGMTKFTARLTSIWDVATGVQIKTMPEHFGGQISYSPNTKHKLNLLR